MAQRLLFLTAGNAAEFWVGRLLFLSIYNTTVTRTFINITAVKPPRTDDMREVQAWQRAMKIYLDEVASGVSLEIANKTGVDNPLYWLGRRSSIGGVQWLQAT